MTSQETPGSKILWLELARFIAAFMVMGVHTRGIVVDFAHFPDASLPYFHLLFFPAAPVDFFFVLSGFVMVHAHAKDFGMWWRLPHYFFSRICRIYPLYWLSLIAALAVWDLTSHSWQFFSQPLFPLFFLIPTQSLSQTVELNPVAWSLRFEVTFYIGFMLLFLRRIGRLAMALWLMAIFWNTFPVDWPWRAIIHVTHIYPTLLPVSLTSHILNGYVLLFFAGLAGGVYYRHVKPGLYVNFFLLAVTSLGLMWEWLVDGDGWLYPSADIVIPVGLDYALWIASLARAEQLGALPRWRALRTLGVLSYPLYLFHSAVLWEFTLLLPRDSGFVHRLPALFWFSMLLTASMAVAWMAAYWIDRPLQGFFKRCFVRAL